MFQRPIANGLLAIIALYLWGCNSAVTPASVSQMAERASQMQQVANARLIPHAPLIYVVNVDASITAYDANDEGDVRPDIRIAGPNTQMQGSGGPLGIALDSFGRLYVCCANNSYINIFAAGANGDVKPIATICTPFETVPEPLAIGRNGDQDVVIGQNDDALGFRIIWFEQGAHGCADIHTIDGPQTDINSPVGVAVDANGLIIAANSADDFGVPGITVHRRDASGNSRPLRFISGPHTTLTDGHLMSLALGSNGQIYALSEDKTSTGGFGTGGFISVFDNDANGDAPPVQALRGPDSRLSVPLAIAADSKGLIYVVNGNNTITVYDPKRGGPLKPVRFIGGPRTTMNCPCEIAVYEPH